MWQRLQDNALNNPDVLTERARGNGWDEISTNDFDKQSHAIISDIGAILQAQSADPLVAMHALAKLYGCIFMYNSSELPPDTVRATFDSLTEAIWKDSQRFQEWRQRKCQEDEAEQKEGGGS